MGGRPWLGLVDSSRRAWIAAWVAPADGCSCEGACRERQQREDRQGQDTAHAPEPTRTVQVGTYDNHVMGTRISCRDGWTLSLGRAARRGPAVSR